MAHVGLVGRDAELALLLECLAAAEVGEPRVVLCRGEPGIGKTRLAEEVVAAARGRGVAAVWGRAAEAPGAPPYWPWRQVLRALDAAAGVAAAAADLGVAADLAGLAPELFAEAGSAEPPSPPTDEDRFRQFDAVARLLRELTARAPVLAVLEDAHWADPASLLLLRHVVRGLEGERLFLLVNHRDTEPAGPLAADLLRERPARVIALAGLALPAVRRCLEDVTGRQIEHAEAVRVHALTGGNPFYVAEMARVPVAGAALPTTVREAIAARVARLTARAGLVLAAGSVVGREFAVPLVAAMTDLPVPACLAAADEAVAAGLVESGAAPGEVRFVHALVRDAVEAGVGTAERVRLHRAAAEALERLHAWHTGPHLFDLARHWAAASVAGDADRAAGWVVRAAEEAMRRLAYEDATRLYEQALVLGGGMDPAQRCRVLVGAAKAHNRVGAFGAGIGACWAAAALAQELGRPDLLAEVALVAEPVWQPPVRRLCALALAAVATEPSPVLARLSAKYAETFVYTPEISSAGPLSERALAMAEACGDPRAVAAALRARAVVCSGPDGLPEREQLAQRMLALGRTCADPEVELAAGLWAVDAAFERGDLAGVAAQIDLLAPCAAQVRGPIARFKVLQCRASLAQAQARFTDARAALEEASTLGHPEYFFVRAAVLGLVGRQAGPDEECTRAVAMADAPPEAEAPLIGPVAYAAGLAAAGRLAEAEAVYRSLGPVAAWRFPGHVELCARAMATDVALASGNAADVRTMYDQLGAYRGHHVASGTGAFGYNGPVEFWLGVAAAFLAGADPAYADAAVGHLEQAVRACAVNGAAGYRVEGQVELAAALARRGGRGDAERARSLLADGARQARALGLGAVVARARALAGEPGGTSPAEALTRREREVAELVAQGLTNRQIAERLHLSERTAQNHVQHILTKLGLRNRSQIAVWVARQVRPGAL